MDEMRKEKHLVNASERARRIPTILLVVVPQIASVLRARQGYD